MKKKKKLHPLTGREDTIDILKTHHRALTSTIQQVDDLNIAHTALFDRIQGLKMKQETVDMLVNLFYKHLNAALKRLDNLERRC